MPYAKLSAILIACGLARPPLAFMIPPDNPNNQVWLVLASYPRNFDITIPSLLRNTAQPLDRSGNLAGVLVASIGRDGVSIRRKLVSLMKAYHLDQQLEFVFWDEKVLWEACADTIALAYSKRFPYKNRDRHTLERSIIFLELLRRTHERLALKDRPAVFVRADLLQFEEYDMSFAIPGLDEKILLADWHQWHGHNDRLAIIPKQYLAQYFLRLQNLRAYLGEFEMFHPETFLKQSLIECEKAEILSGHYYRTRQGGLVVPENFDASPSIYSQFRHRLKLSLSNHV